MLRFWAHQSTKAKEQRRTYDYYFNHAGQVPQLPANGAGPGRVARALAVPGQVVKRLVERIRRALSE